MSVTVLKADGSQAQTVDLPETVFGRTPNEAIVHSYIVQFLANHRQGNAATKNRSAVARSGVKPWRQKGTGRARSGSSSSPVWTGGGIVFGPSPRCYYRRMPKKQKRAAMLSIFSDKAQNDRVVILESLEMPDHKTKNMADLIDKIGLTGKKVLFLDEGDNKNSYLAARNIPGVKISRARLVNGYDMLHADYLVITTSGLKEIEEVFG